MKNSNIALSDMHGSILNVTSNIDDDYFKLTCTDVLLKMFQKTLVKSTSTGKGKRLSLSKRRDTLNLILSCLYREYVRYFNNDRCVRYFRSKSYYINIGISYAITMEIIDWLSEEGYVDLYQGGFNRKTNTGKTSRLRWTKKLSAVFIKLDPTKMDFYEGHINIRVKDEDKLLVRHDDIHNELYDSIDRNSDGVSDLMKHKKINEVRKSTKAYLGKKYFFLAPLYRIFNNNAFGDGGRFYGSQEQVIGKDYRQSLVINGNHVVELDYSNLHIKMLYDLINVPLVGDAYEIYTSGGHLYDRKIMKMAVMILINAVNESSAWRAISDKVKKLDNADLEVNPDYKATNIIAAIKRKHKPIIPKFGSGEGVKLQNIDSNIALEVMYHFAAKGIPCLCIHDSFIVEQQYEQELFDVMKQKYRSEMIFSSFINYEKVQQTPIHITSYQKSLPPDAFAIDVK